MLPVTGLIPSHTLPISQPFCTGIRRHKTACGLRFIARYNSGGVDIQLVLAGGRLMEAGFEVQLVNTAKVTQYSGLKRTDDRYDAYHLAHLMRLGILPTGYIYPKAERGLRDLLRKRVQLVENRTQHILSFQTQYQRLTGS